MPDFDLPNENDLNALQKETAATAIHPNLPIDAEGFIQGISIPSHGITALPQIITPFFMNAQDPILPLLQAARQRDENVIFIFTPPNPKKDEPFLPIGIETAISDLLTTHDGAYACIIQGRRRVTLYDFFAQEDDQLVFAKGKPIDEDPPLEDKTAELVFSTQDLLGQYSQYDHSIPEEILDLIQNITDPAYLADLIVTTLAPSFEEWLAYMEETSPLARLKNLQKMLREQIRILDLKDSIDARVQAEMNRNQREFYLREQLRVIKKELGESDVWTQDANELKERIESADLPEHARAAALKELERLAQMPPMAPETGIIRSYLNWILDLPWNKRTTDNLDVQHAAEILEQAHYGLKKPKERILEYIAVRSLKPETYRQPILCFVGAPGTGKTSLGKSIAQALGREFVRVSLGGVRDEAEIRGHRRTYIGAMPGRIIKGIRKAGSANPLFMLDEIDKLGHDFRGDPASALLEVLDPEQNKTFSDHYLELDFDLSQVMFITTANTLDGIPDALQDRMEIIPFSSYIEEEKLEIARRFLIPRQMKENGIADVDLRISDGALKRLIREYTYEAGVRNLERTIGALCRKIARAKAEGRPHPQRITAAMLENLLDPPPYHEPENEKEDQVGLAQGLAWTEYGGEVMPVEVAVYDGKGNVQMTGQLGDVMQESVQAALSYLKTRAAALDIPFEVFDRMDIHIHLPEAAIPKDGPSAGITLCTALASALTGRPVRHTIAMSGEITLRGRVLAVGGLREKILAAYRHGIKTVLIPSYNKKDLYNLPPSAKKAVRIIPIKHMDEVLDLALGKEAVVAPPRPKKEEETGPAE